MAVRVQGLCAQRLRRSKAADVHCNAPAAADLSFSALFPPLPYSTTVFSHSQTVVLCGSCSTVLCTPTGGKARLTEGEHSWLAAARRRPVLLSVVGSSSNA